MMEAYIVEWISLIFRWLHLVAGIAWIGASFYFVWLDNSLEEPPRWKEDKGIAGELWAIHGGGIYEVSKYHNGPVRLPKTLHWFRWEAYTTWLTGMFLLIIIYYLGAESYLIDKRIADLSQFQAIGIGLLSIGGGWIVYELICRSPMSTNGGLVGLVLFVIAAAVSYALTQIFSGRGAYIHVGAIIGSIMTGNVFRVIIPSQRVLLAAIERGVEPDPAWAARARLRSTHNTYLTLPLLFIMISAHYPMTYTHPFNWLILPVIIGVTAVTRRYFILGHRYINKPILLAIAAVATIALAIAIAPPGVSVNTKNGISVVSDRAVEDIIRMRCASCHSNVPTDDVYTVAPGGVTLDDIDALNQWAPRIKARTIVVGDMPFMNKTEMTFEERTQIAHWLRAKGL